MRRFGWAAIWLAAMGGAQPALAGEPESFLIENVRILDLGGADPVLSAGDVLVRDGMIVDASGAVPDGVRRIDGNGRVLMAGLVDMHVHIWDRASLGAYLAAGVTTVRNASGMPMHLDLAQRIEAGELLGPRLITTGPILNSPGPNAQINHQMVSSADEARAAVQAQYGAGFRRIKVYSNLTAEAYAAIHDEAERLGMTVMGHSPEGTRRQGMPHDVPFKIAFENLLDDGFTTFEHTETIVWHGLRDRHDAEAMRELASRIAASGIAVDPTLVAFYNLLRVAETKGGYLTRDGVETLNPLLVAQEQPNYERWTHEDVERNRAAFEFYKLATRILAEEGVSLIAGSDAGIFTNIPGVSLIDELALLEEAGLTRHAVLRAATINPAEVLGEAGEVGAVAAGQRADLLLLDGDPTEDLSVLRSPAAVVAGGHYLDRVELARLLASASVHDIERTKRNVVQGLIAQGADVSALGL